MLAVDKENGLHMASYVDMYMSSVDILIYGEFPLLHDLVVHVCVFMSSHSWMS